MQGLGLARAHSKAGRTWIGASPQHRAGPGRPPRAPRLVRSGPGGGGRLRRGGQPASQRRGRLRHQLARLGLGRANGALGAARGRQGRAHRLAHVHAAARAAWARAQPFSRRPHGSCGDGGSAATFRHPGACERAVRGARRPAPRMRRPARCVRMRKLRGGRARPAHAQPVAVARVWRGGTPGSTMLRR